MTCKSSSNPDHAHEYGVPYSRTEFHDEWETDFHAAESVDERLGTLEEWQRRHSDKTLEVYCDNHPSAPECKVYDD